MNNQEIKWLLNYPPMYQKEGITAYSHGLNNILELAKHMGNPQNFFKSIHIAGTNGKGSTSHMLASILQESNYKVGLFTSPHLKDFSERIKCNGISINKTFITSFIKKYKYILKKNIYSFFEIITILAFVYFKQKKIDIAIIEVGMGGKFDATNIIYPILSVITHIGWDHQEILGNTLNEIAYEKSGIIKQNTPVILGPNLSGTEDIFFKVAKQNHADIFLTDNKIKFFDAQNRYAQFLNQNTVLKTVEILKKLNFRISDKNMKTGFENMIKNTNFMGRWHILNDYPKIICDIAHNEDSMQSVAKQLDYESYQHLHIILGFVKGKKILKILSYLPKLANYYFCEPNISRAVSINQIEKLTKKYYKYAKYFNSVLKAFTIAQENATKEDLILIVGSTFVVAEILKKKSIFVNYMGD